MVFKRGKRNKKGTGQDKPERISNRLDHKLIAESRRLPKKKKIAVAILAVVLVGGAVGGATVLNRDEPSLPPVPKNDDPFQGQEPDWQPIFHYKPEGQQ